MNRIKIILSVIACKLLIFAGKLVSMYTDNEAVVTIAAETLRIGIPFMAIAWSAGNVLPAGIRGMGNVKFPATVITLSLWIYKIPATWYACSFLRYGAQGRMFVYAFESVIYAVLFAGYAVWVNKKIKKIKKETVDERIPS